MLALARRSAIVLFGLLLSPLPLALPARGEGEEENCVHLTGYGGPQKSTARQIRPQGGQIAAGICAVDQARTNRGTPIKTNADFVPVTGDDALGFYCVYGVRASTSGGIGGNVGIFLFELDNGEVLVFGSGYGNIQGANLFDAAYDMERVDEVIQFCMGKTPADTPLRIVVPHGHGDHVNPACNRELERLGYRILEIAFHQGDTNLMNGMTWTGADRALFRVLPGGGGCLQELTSYSSPLGKIWFFERPGHTAGSIDLVIDVNDDPTNRFVVRGSQPGAPCMPLPGQREIVDAHGNVELLSIAPTLATVAPESGSALGGTPLTLTGTRFTASGAGAHRVLLDGVAATNVVVLNDTTLTCRTPAGPPGQLVEVAVVNNNGKAVYSGSFLFNALPTVSSLTPANGEWRGDTLVQVRGSGYLHSPVEVFFGSQAATAISVKSASLLTCRTPAGLPGTQVNVLVRTPNGQAQLTNGWRYDGDFVIASVTPPSATALGGATIVLTGSSFTGDGNLPEVTFGGVPASTVKLLSDTSVSCVAPQGTPGSTVDIELINSAGSAVYSGFRYHATPGLTTVSPASGRSTGGTRVTLTGRGFSVDAAGTNQVRFGGILASQVVVTSDTALTCLTPAGVVGALVNVRVTNTNGTATLTQSFTYIPPLGATSLVPTSGTALGGNLVTVAGSGFLDGPAGTNTVTFGGMPATQVSVQSDGVLTCRAPAGAALGVVDVAITNANGTIALPASYRYHGVPTLSSISPNNGHALTATSVTLTGTGFLRDAAGIALVAAGGNAATDVVVVDDTTMRCTLPPGVAGATVSVTLANQNGNAALAGAFRYHTAPTLTAASPASGAAAGQVRVTLTGNGFVNDQAGAPVITFGGLAASSVSVLSETSVRCNAPVGPAGQTVDVVVANARGNATLPGGYRFHARPTVTAAVPARGTSQGGTVVTLSGTGFQVDGAGTHTVLFGGASASAVSVLSDGSLRCTTPPGALNAVVDVTVTNANGTATFVSGFTYSVPPPAVLGLTPASGPAHAPGLVRVTGSGFLSQGAGANVVEFGATTAGSVTVIDDAALTCLVPPGPPGTQVDVRVTNLNGAGQLVGGFRYHARPVLTGLTPPSASALGGTAMELAGSGFLADAAGANVVTFGGQPAANVTVVNDTTLTCLVPAGAGGTSVDVRVSNANGDSSSRSFPYHAQPALLALTPETGPLSGGQRVTFTGSGFLAGNAGTNLIYFGDRTGRSVLVVSDTVLTCVTPRGVAGRVDVTLSNANGAAVRLQGYNYGKLPPMITSIEPASGPAGGRTLVTLKGSGFDEGLNRVKFGTALSPDVITLDDETLLCMTPAGPAGTTVDVALNNALGTVTALQAFRYHALPTLTAVTPREGDPLGKTRVTLLGSGFRAEGAGETAVLFDNVLARNVVVHDDSRLSCSAYGKPGAVFDVSVHNANGSASLADAYRIVGDAPVIAGISPGRGAFVGGTLVTITGTAFRTGATRVSFADAPATDVVVSGPTQLRCTTPPGVLGERVDVSVTTAEGSATRLDGFTYGPIEPELAAVAPADGPAGGGTRVTLTGSGFTAAGAGVTRVRFGPVQAGKVAVVDDATLRCDAPPGVAGSTVDVVVENANGDDGLPQAFRYHASPTLTKLTPARGHSDGGTQVTLTGTGFTSDGAGDNLVLFGGVAALDVVELSDTALTCRTPPGVAGTTVDVRVANLNGTANLAGAYRYHTRPAITAVAPANGPTTGGTALLVTGSGFQRDQAGANQVRIGGVLALDVATLDDGRITCSTPPHAAGSVDVTVVNANGTATAAGAFRYFAPPVLAGIAPVHGPPEGGTPVTLTGSGFLAADAGDNLVLFGGLSALDVVELSDTLLTCTAPPGVSGTQIDVSLVNRNGVATLPAAFRYHGPPVLSAVTPDHTARTGATVTLLGTGFLADDAGTNSVTFGGIAATRVQVASDTTLTCLTPDGVSGAVVDVSVTNANGSSALAAAFRYHATPVLTSVQPARGPAAGGTTVTLTGAGFLVDEAGKNLVLFGDFLASNVVVVDDTTLTCKAPAGPPGTLVHIAVGNQNGAARRDDAYRFNPLPRLTGLAPASGTELGGTLVTLSGGGFAAGSPGASTVLFGTQRALAVDVQNDGTLTCLTPPAPGGTVVDVTVSNANGDVTLADAYRYVRPPALTACSPADGSGLGGSQVTLTGSGFADPGAGATLVIFGGVSAPDVVVLDDQSLRCTTPANSTGSAVDVLVANDNGIAELRAGYRYHALPALTSVLPPRGSSAASSAVILKGSGFASDGAGTNTVLFGSVPATAVSVVDDTTLTCTVAPQASDTVVDVSVVNANGAAFLVGGFAFDAPAPTLVALSPISGPSTGGTTVTLTGSGFQAFSAGTNSVLFGAAPAADVVAVDDATLTCTAPSGVVGTVVDVTVSNVNGSALLPAAFTYVVPPPVLIAVTPASTKAAGGATVTLQGRGFLDNGAGTNLVSIGGLPAAGVTVLDDTSLTCVVPAGAAGTSVAVEVTNANGLAQLPAGFRYHAQPVITSLSPPDGTALGGTLVTLRGSGFLNDGAAPSQVRFGSSLANSVVVAEDGRLTCRVPSGAAGATVNVTLTNSNGTALVTNAYRYHARPTVLTVTPASGAAPGGNRVTLSGTGFTADGAVVNVVSFGGVTASSVSVQNDTTIQCNVPAGTAGLAVQVTVANVNGTGLLPGGYRYHARPTLAAAAPANGPPEGGATITLTGTGFLADAPGTNVILLDGAAATDVYVLGDGELTFLLPAGPPTTTVDVSLSNANGTATLFSGFTYDAVTVPLVVATAPSRGSMQGGTPVRLTGRLFAPGMEVTFGSALASNVVVVDDRTIDCNAPPSALEQRVDVSVRWPEGSASLPLAFQYVPPPKLTRVDPPVGPPEGGTNVVVTGTGFLANEPGLNRVTFAGRPATDVVVLDDQHLSCTAPSGPVLTEGHLVVTNTNGTALVQRAFRWQRLLATDLDSDGRGDLVLSSPGDDTLARDAGAVRVFFGTDLPIADRTSAQADLTLLPERVATGFGLPVASGDLDGDGHAELFVGAPNDSQRARDAGSVLVFGGPLAARGAPLVPAEARIVLFRIQTGDRFGSSLALRDLDRDGVLDLLVGALGRTGAVHVFRGGAGNPTNVPTLRINGEFGNEGFASSLAAGDLDGDGWPEIVVGAPDAFGPSTQGSWRPGEVRVFRGGPDLLTTPNPLPWLIYSGQEDGERFGAALAVKDLTGDGIEDLVVGAPASARSGTASGAVFVFHGGSSFAGGDAAAAQSILVAENAGDQFGSSLATGDSNGDGRADLLVGAPAHAGSGRAYVFHGGAPLGDRPASGADTVLDGEVATQGAFGSSVALIDVDGDGVEELVVTAPGLDSGGADLGRVYVFGGAAQMEARQGEDADGKLTGSGGGEQLGSAMTSEH